MGNSQAAACTRCTKEGNVPVVLDECDILDKAEVTVQTVGQQRKLVIERDGATVEVYLFGATITKFRTEAGQDAIWLSSCAKLDGTKAICGGIPLVFPQFGQPIKGMDQHGFARNNVWTYAKKTNKGVILTLDSTQATHEAWNHTYSLIFQIDVHYNQLETTLSVMNTGKEEFAFQGLQHTYLNVGDITRTVIGPVKGFPYIDKTATDPAAQLIETRHNLTITQLIDRIFVGVLRPLEQVGQQNRTIQITCPERRFLLSASAKAGDQHPLSVDHVVPADLVVWNPWKDAGKVSSDFDDSDFKQMLCVQPGLVSDFHKLPAGKSMHIYQSLCVVEN